MTFQELLIILAIILIPSIIMWKRGEKRDGRIIEQQSVQGANRPISFGVLKTAEELGFDFIGKWETPTNVSPTTSIYLNGNGCITKKHGMNKEVYGHYKIEKLEDNENNYLITAKYDLDGYKGLSMEEIYTFHVKEDADHKIYPVDKKGRWIGNNFLFKTQIYNEQKID